MITTLNTLSPSIDMATEILSQNDTATINCSDIVNVYERVAGDNAVPVMTSNTAPSGVASTYPVSASAYVLFDRAGYSPTLELYFNGVTCFIQYQFPSATTIAAYGIQTQTSSNRAPRSWNVQGSSDGTSWTTIDTRVDTALPDTTLAVFELAAPATYTYYKFNVLAMMANTQYFHVGTFDLYAEYTYSLLEPSVDYTVSRDVVLGATDHVITRSKAGTDIQHLISYL